MRAIVLAILAACGGAQPRAPSAADPPAPRRAPKPVPPGERPSLPLSAVLPDRGARPWPLTELPSTQPHWDVAMARDACTKAWADRHAGDTDALAYIAAWCRIRAGNRGALDDLGRVARDARAEIAKPARLDIVNLAADYMDGRRAVKWLDSLSLGQVATLDALAATYRVLGSRDDAGEVNDEIVRRDAHPTPRAFCERTLATTQLDDPGLRRRMLFDARDTGDCGAAAWTVWCVLTMAQPYDGKCFAQFADDPDRDAKLTVLTSYLRWRNDPAQLVELARSLMPALHIYGAEAVAVAALEHAVALSHCDPAISALAQQLRAADAHSDAFDARLAALCCSPCSPR